MPGGKNLETYHMHLIYIYVYTFKKNNNKKKNSHIRIMNLVPSRYGYFYESITPKIYKIMLFFLLLIHINTDNRMEIN